MTRLRNLAVDLVSRAPARVETKLLVAFLAMVVLLILLGGVGLRLLGGMSAQTEELIELQRKIAAYRHVQHDTTRQLYGVSSALLSQDERALDSVLRQLSQFGYDLDRLQYVAQDEVELLAEVRADYDRFIQIVTQAVERARAGQISDARELQLSQARPLADRLERLTNQLVNVAEADMLEHIEASQRAYATSRTVVAAWLDLPLHLASRARRADGARMTQGILVVEDQEDNRRIIRDLLESVGYDLIEAVDGAAGVRLAQSERPDLILMDIQLPVLDGYEATRRIKADPGLSVIPIVVVTSCALSGDDTRPRRRAATPTSPSRSARASCSPRSASSFPTPAKWRQRPITSLSSPGSTRRSRRPGPSGQARG